MLAALWSMEVMSEEGGVGVGVVIFVTRRTFGDFFESGRILGGDGQYFYTGTYTIENRGLVGEVAVTHYAGEPYSVFGPDRTFRLRISTRLDPHVDRDVIMVSGQRLDRPGQELSLRLTRRAAVR